MNKNAVICLAIVFCLATAACGSNKNSQDEITSPDGHTTSTPEEEQVKNDLFTVEGKITGLIDNNSFEAAVSGDPVVFRLENAVSVFEEKGINDGDIVKIGYILDQNGQKIVKTIEKN
ncbi:MAG TPA: hypothetical protein DCE11_00685 [Ruminiclostridium sp.]|jgi:hypothetical protein|nr:hypothetical protein [Clostridiaceae bacterium]HAA24620.1 hypothetical protein [Ruminiclostridium sp.]